jgi:hypothetical protein
MRCRRRWVAGAGLAVMAPAGLAWWVIPPGLAEQVEAEVRAGVPLGTPRDQAESWFLQTYGTFAIYLDDPTGDRFTGLSVPELAGVPAGELKGMVRGTVRRRGHLGRAVDRIAYEHVWVYFLIDRQVTVSGYYFLPFSQLRTMERESGVVDR